MIICHPLKIIFIKTKKVGGTSFEIALSKFCSKDCVITPILKKDEATRADLGFWGPQNHEFTYVDSNLKFWSKNFKFRGKFTSHNSSKYVQSRIPSEIWNSYRVVTIHRNPFDVLVSKYFFKNRNVSPDKILPFDEWFKNKPDMILENSKIAPMSGADAVDIVLRYECLEEDIKHHLGDEFWSVFSKLNSKGNLRSKSSKDLDEFYKGYGDIVEHIKRECRDEIEFFNHDIPKV